MVSVHAINNLGHHFGFMKAMPCKLQCRSSSVPEKTSTFADVRATLSHVICGYVGQIFRRTFSAIVLICVI